ncbi:MAG: M23 family metallopeptidase [Pseudomonadota bacterium]
MWSHRSIHGSRKAGNTTTLPIRGGILRVAGLAILAFATLPPSIPLAQDDIRPDSLAFPIDCELEETCFIQNYVDRDPGPGIADFTCGPMTYDGHQGTDFRLIDDAAMHRGVDVRAALDGIVIGTRDGMADRRWDGKADLQGRDCGNGIHVQREDGVSIQYCHLRKGSVSVRKGDSIQKGQKLGLVGLSGRTQFPHLHVTVRNPAGAVLDPFDTRLQDATCRFSDRRDLWSSLSSQDYQPGGLVNAGFADQIPEYLAIQSGTADRSDTLDRTAPALVVWANFFGLRRGDTIDLLLTDPAGKVIAQSSHQMNRNRAQQMRATGRKRRGDAWPSGVYTAVTVLRRGFDIVSKRELRLTLK